MLGAFAEAHRPDVRQILGQGLADHLKIQLQDLLGVAFHQARDAARGQLAGAACDLGGVQCHQVIS